MNHFLAKQYSETNYHCAHFAAEVWQELTAESVDLITPQGLKRFKRIEQPCEPCVVAMHGVEEHCGIFTNGKVLHLTRQGARYQPLFEIEKEYTRIRYYA